MADMLRPEGRVQARVSREGNVPGRGTANVKSLKRNQVRRPVCRAESDGLRRGAALC